MSLSARSTELESCLSESKSELRRAYEALAASKDSENALRSNVAALRTRVSECEQEIEKMSPRPETSDTSAPVEASGALQNGPLLFFKRCPFFGQRLPFLQPTHCTRERLPLDAQIERWPTFFPSYGESDPPGNGARKSVWK